MSTHPRPRLFLDLDGVVNAPHPPWLETTTFTVSDHRGDHRGGGYVTTYSITVAPAMVAAIDQLRADFDLELVILSTWLENPEMIGQLTEALDALHHPRLLTIPKRKFGGYRSSLWKREALIEDLENDPPSAFIWADDDETPLHGDFVRQVYDLPSLMLGPDPEHGITPGDLVTMLDFLEQRRH
ncbi:HAD domain-containing protein [Frigoribacterium sp. UYMn621]|uniref:HAD domain-containing protein n=1 Tax=Frigoribacterium sp. UYMn621 TaxID=3156343 RepID=UPI003395EA95